MSTAIRVENLSKRFLINQEGARVGSLREAMVRAVGRLGGRGGAVAAQEELDSESHSRASEFWALRDVSFEVHEGERIGIIGANGAGKSTLLKILSRITPPTKGSIAIRGKVSSLLEVGTGFHPELSGRENIYLNGAILGMSRAEIRAKFDAIVDFSGVEAFLDTPVKRYSSGMYVRLAFAVSAWLDPDILIVDEVLAVGDQAFQRKCAERMKELTREGKTVLFVSHSMASVNSMCQKALYLRSGRALAYGPVEEITSQYLRWVAAEGGGGAWHQAQFTYDPKVHVTYSDDTGDATCLSGRLSGPDGVARAEFDIAEDFAVEMTYRVERDLPYPVVPNFHFYLEDGARFFISMPENPGPGRQGTYTARCTVPAFLCNVGRFSVTPALSSYLSDQPLHFAILNPLQFEVIEGRQSDPRRHGWGGDLPGPARPRLSWSITP